MKYIYCCILLFQSYIQIFGSYSDTSFIFLDSITVKSRLFIKNTDKTAYSSFQKNIHPVDIGNFRTTPEALMGKSGVFVQKTNHGGGSAFLRGLTGNQTLLIIDGIRINNATFRYGPNQYLNTIDINSIDQIEVFKGTGSVEYGSDAIGGVIHLHTKMPAYRDSANWSGKLMAKYIGQDMEKTARTTIQYAAPRFAIEAGVTVRNFGDLVGGGNLGTQLPSGYDETGYDLNAKIKLGAGSEITFLSKVYTQNNVPIYHKVLLENFLLNSIHKQEKKIHAIQYDKIFKNKIISKIKITQSIQYSNEERASIKKNSPLNKFEQDQIRSTGTSIDAYSTPSKYWTINSGIDYNMDKISSLLKEQNSNLTQTSYKRGLYPNQSNYQSFSVFSLHKIEYNKWQITTGIRWNRFSIQLYDSSIGQINIQPTALVGNLGISYLLGKHHLIYSSVASGYRAPNIDDMGTLGVVDFRYEVPTDNLAPEKSIHYEIGYKINTKKIDFILSGFHLNLKDIITRQKIVGSIINGYQVYSKQNSERSYIKGFETNLDIKLNKHFSWTSNLTFTYGQNNTKMEPMRRIPPLFGQQEFVWKKNTTQFQFTHLFASKQNRLAQEDKDDNRIGVNGTPEWNLFNMSISQQTKYLFIQLGGINLLNEKYKTHGSGIYSMGRTYSVMLQLHW